MSISKNNKRSVVISIAVGCIFFLYVCMARTEPSILVDYLIKDFKSTASVIGFVLSVVYIPYVVMQIPYGLLVDRFGLKATLVTGSVLCSVGALIFGLAESVLQLEIGRFLVGMSAASGFLCCGKAASYYPDQSKYGVIVGLANVSGMAGGTFGSILLVPLVSYAGWRGTTYFVASLGILVLILSALCIKGRKKEEQTHKKSQSTKCLKIIATKPQIWLIGIYGFMSELPITGIAELWGMQFAIHRFETTEKMASLSSSIIFIAFGIGSIVSGLLADRIRNFRWLMVTASVGMAASFVPAVYFDNIEFSTFLMLLFVTGFFGGWNILCFSVVFRFVSKEFGGTVTGFVNMIVMSSGLVAQPILGRLLDFFRNGLVTESGEPIYNLAMYRSSFMSVVLCMVIAIIIPFFIKKDNPQCAQVY